LFRVYMSYGMGDSFKSLVTNDERVFKSFSLWDVLGNSKINREHLPLAGRSGDRIPVWARFSAPFQTGAGGPPSLLYNGYGVFPRVKTAGAWC
jgi:hypothetical protein